jgi:hypothetical protein
MIGRVRGAEKEEEKGKDDRESSLFITLLTHRQD